MVIGVATIPLLDPATLRAGIVVALATGLYFLLFRWSIGARLRPNVLPAKEIAIALCFTAGAAIAASSLDLGDLPALGVAHLGQLPSHFPPRVRARRARGSCGLFLESLPGTTFARDRPFRRTWPRCLGVVAKRDDVGIARLDPLCRAHPLPRADEEPGADQAYPSDRRRPASSRLAGRVSFLKVGLFPVSFCLAQHARGLNLRIWLDPGGLAT